MMLLPISKKVIDKLELLDGVEKFWGHGAGAIVIGDCDAVQYPTVRADGCWWADHSCPWL